jgi:hypothetical protein
MVGIEYLQEDVSIEMHTLYLTQAHSIKQEYDNYGTHGCNNERRKRQH